MANGNTLLKMLREHTKDNTYHPMLDLHDLLSEDDCTIGEKINILKAELKYTEAEMKAIEFTGKINSGVDFNFNVG